MKFKIIFIEVKPDRIISEKLELIKNPKADFQTPKTFTYGVRQFAANLAPTLFFE